MGLGQCCLFNSTILNNYNPLISSTPFCVCLPAKGQLYNVASPVFAITTLLPLFALGNHFLSQELLWGIPVTQTYVEHQHTHTLTWGFAGNFLTRKCVPWIAPLGSCPWPQYKRLRLWRAADFQLTSTYAWAAAQSSLSPASVVPSPTASTDTCSSEEHDFISMFLCVDWVALD